MISEVTGLPNLRSAFARVEASHGMAGVDRVSIGAFRKRLASNLADLSLELREGRYRPLPLLKFLVAKKDGSPRALTVPTVRDRVAQAAVLNVVEPLFEREFEDASFAYRKGRSVKGGSHKATKITKHELLFFVSSCLRVRILYMPPAFDLEGYLAGKR